MTAVRIKYAITHVNVVSSVNKTETKSCGCSILCCKNQRTNVTRCGKSVRPGPAGDRKNITFPDGAHAIPSKGDTLAPELLFACFVQAGCPLHPGLPKLHLSFTRSVVDLYLVFGPKMNLSLRFSYASVKSFPDR